VAGVGVVAPAWRARDSKTNGQTGQPRELLLLVRGEALFVVQPDVAGGLQLRLALWPGSADLVDGRAGRGHHVVAVEDDLGRMELWRLLALCLRRVLLEDSSDHSNNRCRCYGRLAVGLLLLVVALLAEVLTGHFREGETYVAVVCLTLGLRRSAGAARSTAKALTVAESRPEVVDMTLRRLRLMKIETRLWLFLASPG